MSGDIIGDYVIHNKKAVNADDFDYSLTSKYPGIYEVIRIIDGVPLFLEKHLERFRSSSNLLGYDIKEPDESIKETIKNLLDANKLKVGNIKLVINSLDKSPQDSYAFVIKSRYPSKEEINNGVPAVLFSAERSNPNAKTTDLKIREKINQKISESNAYEAILVNKNGEITEGSKSNIFFIKGESIYTSPIKDVLPGVTRGYVLDICKSLGLNIHEAAVNTDFLNECDGLFLTGTSPQVLPISSVDGKTFLSPGNAVITSIRKAYENLVENYIKDNKNGW
jgi:branched-chain amino acid aminotransferase